MPELQQKTDQPRSQRQHRGLGAITAPQFQHIFDNAIDALGLLTNDARQAQVMLVQVRGFGQQGPGMADGTQGIADLMGNTGCQTTQRGQLELLRLLCRLCGIFQKQQGPTAIAMTDGDILHQQLVWAGRAVQADLLIAAMLLPVAQFPLQFGAVIP